MNKFPMSFRLWGDLVDYHLAHVLSRYEVLDGGTVVPGFKHALAELFTAATEAPVATPGSGPAR